MGTFPRSYRDGKPFDIGPVNPNVIGGGATVAQPIEHPPGRPCPVFEPKHPTSGNENAKPPAMGIVKPRESYRRPYGKKPVTP